MHMHKSNTKNNQYEQIILFYTEGARLYPALLSPYMQPDVRSFGVVHI